MKCAVYDIAAAAAHRQKTVNTICTWPLTISIAVRLKHLFVSFLLLFSSVHSSALRAHYMHSLCLCVRLLFLFFISRSLSNGQCRSLQRGTLSHEYFPRWFYSFSTESRRSVHQIQRKNLHMQIRLHVYECSYSTNTHRGRQRKSVEDRNRKRKTSRSRHEQTTKRGEKTNAFKR